MANTEPSGRPHGSRALSHLAALGPASVRFAWLVGLGPGTGTRASTGRTPIHACHVHAEGAASLRGLGYLPVAGGSVGQARVVLLGTGGGAPSDLRETASTLIRDGDRALVLDLGTGARRLLTDPTLLDGVSEINVVLTHFHLDHTCGLTYLAALPVRATIWAPGIWLYGVPSAELLEPLRLPPISPTDVTGSSPVHELAEGGQTIAAFEVRAVAQPRHWAPSVGLRIDDKVALVTDTPYEPTSCALADGVEHLLHEAWSSSAAPRYADRDATAADAGRVARDAKVGHLTLIHLNPALAEHSPILEDARRLFERVSLGEDKRVLGSGSKAASAFSGAYEPSG